MSLLLSSYAMGGLTLPNRVVMAPLTRCRAAPGDVPSDLAVEYYRQRASAGLIVSEGSPVTPQGKGYDRSPGCYSADQALGWRRITDAVHAEGGRMVLQLWHVGRVTHPWFLPEGSLPVAPSAIAVEGRMWSPIGPLPYVVPQALSLAEIKGVVEAFAQAGRLAMEAGFDGVEIHAANGYLIDQFLRDGSNHRTDAYGGSVANRCRLLCDIIEALDPIVGSSRIGVRISPVVAHFSMSDSDPELTFGYLADCLSAYRLAYLHVVHLGPTAFDFANLRRAYRGAYIACGGFDPLSAEAYLQAGHADLVAFGHSFVANPDLVRRIRDKAPLNVPDRKTFYVGEERGYVDYPRLPDV